MLTCRKRCFNKQGHLFNPNAMVVYKMWWQRSAWIARELNFCSDCFCSKPYQIGSFLYGCKQHILFLFSASAHRLLFPWGLIGPFPCGHYRSLGREEHTKFCALLWSSTSYEYGKLHLTEDSRWHLTVAKRCVCSGARAYRKWEDFRVLSAARPSDALAIGLLSPSAVPPAVPALSEGRTSLLPGWGGQEGPAPSSSRVLNPYLRGRTQLMLLQAKRVKVGGFCVWTC